MLFHSMLKTFVGKRVTVELKNNLSFSGRLSAVDPFLNLKLDCVCTQEKEALPYIASLKTCFVRGSVVRYISLPKDSVDTVLLQKATRKCLA
ncbi:MAG: U6 snRNA-associated Sm-like protein LSm2 [Amphiamblys sp. WSBS2006]|nr:MAG: U6 snRNA-associated Sm-like protein LSm2 [Amphiamblys sp. WSBS2006]